MPKFEVYREVHETYEIEAESFEKARQQWMSDNEPQGNLIRVDIVKDDRPYSDN